MTIPEPGRIVNTQPMTVDRRWPPARHSPSPVTQPRTNVTVRSTPLTQEHHDLTAMSRSMFARAVVPSGNVLAQDLSRMPVDGA